MRKSPLSLVVLADRKSHNGTDEALETIADGVDRFLFLYRGSPLPLPWASPVPRWPLFRKPPACDVLYVRVDWFDRTLRDGLALNIVEWLRPKKVVVGIHCHLCTRDPREEALLGRADAALFLNARARDYFVAKYPGHAWHAKTFLLPSLFLPKRSWYAGATNECSRSETETVVAIPGNVNRLSGLPRQPAEVVPDEFSALNRYDYLRMVRLVAKDPRVRLRIFGSFENLGYPAAERVRALYASAGAGVEVLGHQRPADYDRNLREAHFGLFSGYLPHEIVPAFEDMNYQVRYNSLIKADVLPIVARATAAWHEQEIAETGYGLVVEDTTGFARLGDNLERVREARRTHARDRAIERNSIETYVPALLEFLRGS